MKYVQIAIVLIALTIMYSCSGVTSSSNKVSNKEEYFELKNAVIQCESDFEAKIIDEKKYTKMMEEYGDIYVASIDAIPPEKRYTQSIYCYKQAARHDKTNKELKEKLQEQQKLFQVVN
ncbi:MAG: hypothetical protein PF481_04960 [Bacteroidales bacterium]|jgi:hypothetical protein|nr:hypothetical protein [Bacteroidales bacterium]